MKKRSKESKKITKGMPSAVVLSIVIHASLFLLAGILVVFTVEKKEEQKFEPPKVTERPKMKLKKPKVKIKKSKPQPTTRIVTKMNRANMPHIQLPEMSSMGEGLGSSMGGGFDLIPDVGSISIFGSGQSIGNDLELTFYDLKRDRQGKPLSVALGIDGFRRALGLYIRSGWKPSQLGKYYRSPNKLYSPTIMVPSTETHFGTFAFNEPKTAAYEYAVHGTGSLVSRKQRRIRFWGMGDSLLVIRVNGKVVFDYAHQMSEYWSGTRSQRTPYHLAHWPAWTGHWINLEPGVPLPLEILYGEYSGGLIAAMIVVEEEGVEYPRNIEGGPLLPIFKTAELSLDQIDVIYSNLPENMNSVTNGPIFNDFWEGDETVYPYVKPRPKTVVAAPPRADASSKKEEDRLWTLQNGQSLTASFMLLMGDKVVLKTAKGKQVKILESRFSPADRDYLVLANPPKLKISLKKKETRFRFPDLPGTSNVPVLRELTLGVNIKSITIKPYLRNLTVELFSVGSEIDGNNYVLLDRQKWDFTFGAEGGKDRSVEFWGKEAQLNDFVGLANSVRSGVLFEGHLIVVTDERGIIIAQNISKNWLINLLDPLRDFPVGRHFDKSGARVFPPRPPIGTRFWDASPESR